MSYSCFISFYHIEPEDVYDKLLSIKTDILSTLDIIGKENYYCMPSFRLQNKLYSELDYINPLRTLCQYWVYRITTYRYFYNAEYKLLGVYSLPDYVACKADKTIQFQNSVDQDYEFEEWQGIDKFEEIYNHYMNMSQEDFIEQYQQKYDFDASEIDLSYYRKSQAYSDIWQLFSDTLEDDGSVIYFSLFGFYDLLYIDRVLNAADEAIKDERARWEIN